MTLTRYRATLYAAVSIAAPFGTAMAQSAAAPTSLVPFAEFVAGLRSTTAQQMTAEPSAAVKLPDSAEEMRQHLLRLYDGVAVKHSFVQDSQTFDCIPMDQQPAVRLQGLKSIAAAPSGAPATADAPTTKGGPRALPASQQSKAEFDAFGNAQRCDAGTIPMRRITLPEMSRFETLQKFFEKGPNGAGQVHTKGQSGSTAPSINGHTYAHEYQYVNNYGGYSVLSLYRPYVNTSYGEIFSLSQQWYVGFGSSGVQTAEVGLQNYPAKYGSENSALFIYWTADGYSHTGCYNLDCGAFVQTNGNWHLGAGFNNYSTVGGSQYEVALGYYLYGGNWWLAAGSDWVGYYPGSIYRGGPMSRYAQEFDLGGESDASYYWPPMGSGQYASAGWPRADYHRTILYRDSGNGGHSPSLTVSQQWPSCQTASSPTWGGSTWQTYFFFGGPGGYNC